MPASPLIRSEWVPESLAPPAARPMALGDSAYLRAAGVRSELEAKRAAMREGRLTFHAQIGYRALADSRDAWRRIHETLADQGAAPDRYGVCLDWSMGWAREQRRAGQRGTGLVIERAEELQALTGEAPVAPHFGDFVLGMPAALENAEMAVAAGCTTVGNVAQYFTFRLPGLADDVAATEATAEALASLAAMDAEILIHSNLDDGYAAWFEDMSSALGFAMVERRLIEDGFGLALGHCYGHTMSDPLKRLGFGLALGRACPTPGAMIYGNTTLYGGAPVANYAALASYVLLDAALERRAPSGRAITPIPVSEAERIPTVDEIIDAHRAARRAAERAEAFDAVIDWARAEALADRLVARGARFRDRLFDALDAGGFDLAAPTEILLVLRRAGPGRLEAWFGEPSEQDDLASPFVDEIETLAANLLAETPPARRQAMTRRRPRVLVASGDVHFYGKRLIRLILERLGAEVHDAGASVDAAGLAAQAAGLSIDAIALSTYNGVALDYVRALRSALAGVGAEPLIFIGGRMNQIMDDSGGALPVDVTAEIRQLGALPCATPAEMIERLSALEPADDRDA